MVTTESEHIPLILEKADEYGATRRQKKLLLALELAGEDSEFFGVEFVAAEAGNSDAPQEEKVDGFVTGILSDFDSFYEDYQQTLDEYGEKATRVIEENTN